MTRIRQYHILSLSKMLSLLHSLSFSSTIAKICKDVAEYWSILHFPSILIYMSIYKHIDIHKDIYVDVSLYSALIPWTSVDIFIWLGECDDDNDENEQSWCMFFSLQNCLTTRLNPSTIRSFYHYPSGINPQYDDHQFFPSPQDVLPFLPCSSSPLQTRYFSSTNIFALSLLLAYQMIC